MITFFFFFLLGFIYMYNKKLLILLLLEGMMIYIFFFFFLFFSSNTIPIFPVLFLLLFLVLDSVFGLSVLISSSRDSSVLVSKIISV